jgi:hypothetical protein
MTLTRRYSLLPTTQPRRHLVTRDAVTKADRNLCVGLCHRVTSHQDPPPSQAHNTHRHRRTATKHAAGHPANRPAT